MKKYIFIVVFLSYLAIEMLCSQIFINIDKIFVIFKENALKNIIYLKNYIKY